MKNNRLFILVIVALAALILGACTRSASTPVAPEATFPIPDDGTTSVADELIQSGTATAMAAGESESQVDEPAAEATPEAPGGEQPAQPGSSQQQPPEGQEEAQQPAPQPTQAVQQTYSVPDTYTLQKGEFPYCIARRFNINAGTLLSVNGLNANSLVYPGTVLKIPKDAGPFVGERALRAHGTYTIQPGDTVYSIACLYGDVDPRAIEDANNLTGAYSLNVGSTLVIP